MGGKTRFEFRLDTQRQHLFDRATDKESFWLSINSKEAYFDSSHAPTIIRPGYKTIITIKPTQVISDKSLKRELTPLQRNCRFSNELPENMTLFSSYSMAGCRFECMGNYSYEFCRCLPWNMPRKDGIDYELCDYGGNDCFWSVMNNFTFMGQQCFCLPDCNAVKFSYVEKQMPLELETECASLNRGFQETVAKLKPINSNYAKALKFLPRYVASNTTINWKKNITNPMKYLVELCEEFHSQDISVIEVQMEGQTFKRYRQSLRVTMEDRLSNIGGTLGLCLGFSALAIFESVFWLLKTLYEVFTEKIHQ